MAAETATDKKGKQPEPPIAPPDGLEEIGLPRLDGWYNAEKNQGQWIRFKLLGTFELHDAKRGTDRTIMVSKLATPCVAASAKDSDVVVKLEPGQIVGIGVSFDLREIAEYCAGSVFWIRPKSKRSLDGGRAMWDFDKRREKGEKKSADELARDRVRSPVQAVRVIRGADIPF